MSLWKYSLHGTVRMNAPSVLLQEFHPDFGITLMFSRVVTALRLPAIELAAQHAFIGNILDGRTRYLSSNKHLI